MKLIMLLFNIWQAKRAANSCLLAASLVISAGATLTTPSLSHVLSQTDYKIHIYIVFTAWNHGFLVWTMNNELISSTVWDLLNAVVYLLHIWWKKIFSYFLWEKLGVEEGAWLIGGFRKLPTSWFRPSQHDSTSHIPSLMASSRALNK